jgi:exopolysaccharide biosynthesis polyprenyl glycosylphosphotransferase
MKRAELAFALFALVFDFLMILLAAMAAYFIRFQSAVTEYRPVFYTIPFDQYFSVVLPMAIGWIFLFGIAGLYQLHRPKKLTAEFSKVFLGCGAGILAVILIIFFRQEEFFSSRFIVLAVWFISVFTVMFGRIVLRLIQRACFRKGFGTHKTVVIGNDKTTNEVLTGMNRERSLGYVLAKHFKEMNGNTLSTLEQMMKERGIDDIFITDPNTKKNDTLILKSLCDEYHVTFRYAADTFDAQATNVEITPINGIPIVEIKKTPLDGWGRIGKRIFDILGSLMGIIFFSPIMIAVAIAIKLESDGPILYKNERVSKDGTFFVYKFRSMYTKYCTGSGYSDGAAEEIESSLIKERNERKGPVYKVLNDPRRTKVGKFLERTSIDELPQFFNVFLGNMSLVGPRPHQPREVAKYEKHHKRALSIKPGVTGLAQISGRSDLDFEDEFRLDNYYIENWSIGLDLYIILKTPLVLFKRHRNT